MEANNANLGKFRRVERPKEESPEDEIRVTGAGRVQKYVAYASRVLKEENKDHIVIRASGLAIATAVTTVEELKKRVGFSLFQETHIGVTNLTDLWEPLEPELEAITRTRTVPFIVVKLAKSESLLDKEAYGYQSPEQDLAKTFGPSVETTEEPQQQQQRRPARRPRGGARGGRPADQPRANSRRGRGRGGVSSQ